MLTKLPPLKSILCLVRREEAKPFSVAISDAYLSFATPLPSCNCLSEIDHIIQEERPGAVVFGLPMKSVKQDFPMLNALRDQLVVDLQSQEQTAHSLVCRYNKQITWQEAVERKKHEWEMWEDIDLLLEKDVDAAVALNVFLWEHCGGWRNTFG